MYDVTIYWWIRTAPAVLICFFAFLFGNTPGKSIAVVVLADWFLSPIFHDRHHVGGVELGVFLIDLMAFLIFAYISLKSRLIWTLFVAAFQLNAVAIRLSATISGSIKVFGYLTANWIWGGYGLLIPLLIGTIQSIRERAETRRAAEPSKDERTI